jgi:3-hydroxyisobutyrate dehydrogenase-like beta-hydroxyacid dehydrogenase
VLAAVSGHSAVGASWLFTIAERGGIDRALAVSVLTQSPGFAHAQGAAGRSCSIPEQAWFDVALMRKNLQLALDSASHPAVSEALDATWLEEDPRTCMADSRPDLRALARERV